MSGWRPDAPAILHSLEARGVKVWSEDGKLKFAPASIVTVEEIQDLRTHKAAILDVLAARELPRGEGDVLPAVRAMLSEHPEWAHHEARFLAMDVYLWGYLPWEPTEGQVQAALEALTIDGEVVA
jgi:hypothetical protein